METKKINKEALKGENGRYLEDKYSENKRLFFIDNQNATEQDFIESEIEKINAKEKDNERMWNLSDDDFFQEYRKDDEITKKTNWNIDEAENKKQILRNYRNSYKPSEFENPLLTLYKQKLNSLPKSELKTNYAENKSLLLNGRKLNLSERYKIANKVLDIDKKIRTLNIQDLEKYQLLAYILGCDKDNARNLMNGTYNANDRDLTAYFNDLDLNK